MYLGPTAEIVLLGNPATADMAAVLRELRSRFIPNKVVAMRPGTGPPADVQSKSLDPLFLGKTFNTDEPALYICENFACQAPVIGREQIVTKLHDLTVH